jgi:hypothetical protein
MYDVILCEVPNDDKNIPNCAWNHNEKADWRFITRPKQSKGPCNKTGEIKVQVEYHITILIRPSSFKIFHYSFLRLRTHPNDEHERCASDKLKR